MPEAVVDHNIDLQEKEDSKAPGEVGVWNAVRLEQWTGADVGIERGR